jgi:alpha-tubulin suppressor-like RCC1 family protein
VIALAGCSPENPPRPPPYDPPVAPTAGPSATIEPAPTSTVAAAPAVAALQATAIAVASGRSCAITRAGKLVCWGGSGGPHAAMVSATAREITGISGPKSIAVGARFTCAIDAEARVRCWGDNTTGGLGLDKLADKAPEASELFRAGEPVVGLGVARSIAVSAHHACAIASDAPNDALCWGEGGSGELGREAKRQATANGRVTLSAHAERATKLDHIDAIATGNLVTCALIDGKVHCWGDDSTASTGRKRGTHRDAPSTIDLGERATKIAVGNESACAILTSGKVMCWGAVGGLATEKLPDKCTDADLGCTKKPLEIKALQGAKSIALASGGCAVLKGHVQCWERSEPPHAVALERAAVDVAVSSEHACALLDDATVRCWGDGRVGQLGDGAHESSSAPVLVHDVRDVRP